MADRQSAPREEIRIGTTPVFLDDHLSLLSVWQKYLEERLERKVGFARRRSYQEITDLLLSGQLDAAWVCSPPYLMNLSHLRLLCVPVYEGKPLYRSYLIVQSEDTRTRHISDLRGHIYAFSDPQSNSGCLVPRVELHHAKETPNRFFLKSFFTFSHRRVVDAVALGLAHGGSVDGYVWDTMRKQIPKTTEGTRVAWKSREYGFPPIVARRSLPERDFQSLQGAFVSMHDDPAGSALLQQLNLDGFERGTHKLFASVEANLRLVGDLL
ncbi:MAG TPA: PhnD/SsuA/transferrin family substrate-binding protein [Burkholderiales bacterium]|nr:PhnD/SsuA/transferrin family substrate-binding protein [Burkholderiales bacterium]